MKSKLHGTTYDTLILPPTWENQFDQILRLVVTKETSH